MGRILQNCPVSKGKSKSKGRGGKVQVPLKGSGLKVFGKKDVSKGFSGNCYRCGRQGHREADCRSKVASVEDAASSTVLPGDSVSTVQTRYRASADTGGVDWTALHGLGLINVSGYSLYSS